MSLPHRRPSLRALRARLAVLAASALLAAAALLAPGQAHATGCNPSAVEDGANRFEWQGHLDSVVEILAAEQAAVRATGARCLAAFPAYQAYPYLVKALDDESVDVQLAAIDSLRRVAARGAVDHIARLLDSRDAQVRATAAEALGELGARAYVNRLVSALSDPSGDVKVAAIHALGQLRDPAAIDDITAMLAEDGIDVVVAALRVLGTFGDRTTVYDILAKTRSNAKKVRVEAITALGQLGDPRATLTLVGMLKGQPSDIQRAAVRAIAEIGDPAAVEPLLAMLGPNEGAEATAAVIRALGQLGDERAVEPLLGLLRHQQHVPTVRSALERIGPVAVPYVVRELEVTENHTYQLALLSVLARLPSPAAVGALEEALVSQRFPREDVVRAIAQVRDPQMVEILTLVLPELRERELADVLARMRPAADDRIVAPLVDRYPQTGANTRKQILLTFAQIGDAAALPIVLEELASDDLEIRRLAIHAAQNIGDARAVDGLASALRADDGPLRRQAAVALASIRGPEAIGKLLRAARDTEHPGRRDATWALAFAVRDASDASRSDVERFVESVLEERGHPLTYVALDILATLRPDADDDLDALLTRLYDEGRLSVRRKIVEIIGFMKLDSASAIVIDALGSDDEMLLAEAAWVAGELRLTSAAARLVQLADEPSAAIATNAIAALARLDNRDALDVLSRRLYDAHPLVVAAALRGLHALGATPESWEIERAVMGSGNPILRETAYRVLLEAGDRRTLDALLARERNPALLELLADEAASASDLAEPWLVLDVGYQRANFERSIAERAFLLLPDGRIKAAFVDENGKVRLELDAPGVVKQHYDFDSYVSFPDEDAP